MLAQGQLIHAMKDLFYKDCKYVCVMLIVNGLVRIQLAIEEVRNKKIIIIITMSINDVNNHNQMP